MYHLDPHDSQPLNIQLYHALKADILTKLSQGDKLPSIRKLSNQYNISKTTVQSAYDQLYAEGYIYSKPKSGYFVDDIDMIEPAREEVYAPNNDSVPPQYRYDFFPAQLTDSAFPRKLWKRLSNKAFEEDLDFGSYPNGQGEYGLRREIALYLGRYRGVECTADDIVITNGFIESMELIAKLMRPAHSRFATEYPGYHIARKSFASYGYEIDLIGLGENGIDIDAFARSHARLLYTTPSHQYPTGTSIPVSHRQKLLEIINAKGGYLIEDDYDSELKYSTRPIPALKGLDHNDRVIYLGTFAKALSPAVRIGYMVLPKDIMRLFGADPRSHFSGVSQHLQRTLELFMRDGYFEKHLRRIRTLNRKKHDHMLQTLKLELGETYEIYTKGGGLSILIRPTLPFDWDKCVLVCQKKSIKIYLTKERAGGDIEAFRMGFGGFEIEEISDAIKEFGECWKASILQDTHSDTS